MCLACDSPLEHRTATLCEQGAHINGEAGVGYQLQPGFLLSAIVFSEEQIEALVLGARWVARQADAALCALRQAFRHFRADRVDRLTETPHPAMR